MISLSATTNTLILTTSAAGSIDYYVSYVDITSSTYAAAQVDGNITTATNTTVLSAPAASTQRQVKLMSFYNKSSTVANKLTLKFDVSGTGRVVAPVVTLAPGDCLTYSSAAGWNVIASSGIVQKAEKPIAPIDGYMSYKFMVGSTGEAVDAFHCDILTASAPGAYVVGSPGLAGRATDGTTSTDAGCMNIKAPSTGRLFGVAPTVVSTAGGHFLIDVLVINSGIVVTTTTAQTLNTTALPARDLNFSTNGEGVWAGLFVTTATTNAAANTGLTISYTNSAGTAGRTSRAPVGAAGFQFPATAVAGSLFIFPLQSGDTGVRSVESITLATSFATGAVSLVLFKPLAVSDALLAPTHKSPYAPVPTFKLAGTECIWPVRQLASTTAVSTHQLLHIVEV
jgi:hypothetical protein